MKIKVQRIAFKEAYTIGKLSVDGKYLCDTLEPRSAHVSNKDNSAMIIKQKHLYGKIAIPTGTFKIEMAMSQKFHKLMPFLNNVKGFEGVMIHPGNYPKDTLGCILPGWNRRKGMVCGSITAFSEIMALMRSAFSKGEEVKVLVWEP